MRDASVAILLGVLMAMPGCVVVNRSAVNTSMPDEEIERIVRERLSTGDTVEDKLRIAYGMTDWNRLYPRFPTRVVPWDESASQLTLPLAKRAQKRGLFGFPFVVEEEVIVTIGDDGSIVAVERREPDRRDQIDYWLMLPCRALETQWATLDPWREPGDRGVNPSGTVVLLEPGRAERFLLSGSSSETRYFEVQVQSYGVSTDEFPVLTPIGDFGYVVADQWASGGRPLALAGSWVPRERFGFNRFPDVASSFCFSIIVEPGARAEFEIQFASGGGS